MKNWRIAGEDTVVAEVKHKRLRGLNKTAVVRENLEAIVVLKNGLVDEVCTAGAVKTLSRWEAFKGWFGLGPSIHVYYFDITPKTLEFWLEDPAVPRAQTTGQAFGMPGLTSDKQLIPAQVNVTVSIDPNRPELLLRAFKDGGSSLTIDDLRTLMRDQLLATIIGPALAQRSAEELRGNRTLLDQLYEDACAQLNNMFTAYGLQLDVSQFYINWGLTHDESIAIEERRLSAEIAHVKHKKELEQLLNNDTETDQEDPAIDEKEKRDDGMTAGRDVKFSINTGLDGKWITLLLGIVIAGIIGLTYLLST